MNYLLRKRTIKPAWLIAFSVAGLLGSCGAYAKDWAINSLANKNTSNTKISKIYSDTKFASTDSTLQDRKIQAAGRSIDRGVLLAQSKSDGASYRGSSYKTNEISEAPALQESISGPETASNIPETLEASRSVGKGMIYPVANLSFGYRDDVFEADANGVAQETRATTLQWRFGGGYQGSNRGHLNGLEYTTDGIEFLSGNNDENETSQRLTGYWGTAFTPRHHLDLGVEYIDAYDPRGRGDSLKNIRFNTVGQESDQWNELTGGGIYSFGGESARGRIELSAYLTNREYENNRQQYRNRDELDLGATVYLKVMQKTEFYGQVVGSDLDYIDQGLEDPTLGRDLDSKEMRYLVGLKWYPSEELSGTFRVGTTQKTFNTDSARQDYNELGWDSNLLWKPNARNNFGLSYSRSPREAFAYSSEQLIDDYIEIENLDFSWSHSWAERLNTMFTYTLGQDDFFPSGRKDDRDEFTVSLSYDLPRWGAVGLTYFNRQRESDVADQDYDDNGFTVHFNLGTALGLGDGNSRAPGVRNLRQYQPGYAIY
jgi:hypothetical protein